MNYKHIILLTAVLSLALLGGCTAGEAEVEPEDTGAPNVDKAVFEDDGVVCYIYKDSSGYAGQGGISCLPLGETHVGPRR